MSGINEIPSTTLIGETSHTGSVRDQIFQAVRHALEPFMEYDIGDHTESLEVNVWRFVWNRQLYHEGEYFDVTLILRPS